MDPSLVIDVLAPTSMYELLILTFSSANIRNLVVLLYNTLDSREKRRARNERVGKRRWEEDDSRPQPIIRFYHLRVARFLCGSVTVTRIGYRLLYCTCTGHL